MVATRDLADDVRTLIRQRSSLAELGKEVHTALNPHARRRLAHALLSVCREVETAVCARVGGEFCDLMARLSSEPVPTEAEIRILWRELISRVDGALATLPDALAHTPIPRSAA